MTDAWPHIGPRELRRLWDHYAPRFLRLDDVEHELPQVREQFLRWLTSTGVDLSDPLGRGRVPRLKLEEVGLERHKGLAETLVTMTFAGDSASSSRVGDPEPSSILQLAASATLEVVSKLAPTFDFGLDTTFLQSRKQESIAISVVNEELPRRLRGLVGAASVFTTPHEAIARATLHAVNRQISLSVDEDL